MTQSALRARLKSNLRDLYTVSSVRGHLFCSFLLDNIGALCCAKKEEEKKEKKRRREEEGEREEEKKSTWAPGYAVVLPLSEC